MMPEQTTQMRCLYRDTARAAIEALPLEGEARAAVAIVGGGYTGLSAALHLAERGIGAVVLEAQDPGWGASGRNGGQVNPGLYPDPHAVIADFGELGRRMLAFASAAPDRVFDLVRSHAIDCEARQSGTLRAAYHAAKRDAVRGAFDQHREQALPAEWIDAAGLAEATGTGRYLGGIRFPQGGSLNALGYARGLAEAAQRAGASIHGRSPALSVERVPDGWRVATSRGSVRAERLVIATNAYSGPLWPGLAATVVPVHSTIAATAPLPADVLAGVMPSRSVLYEVGHNTVYYRLDGFGRLLMGGRGVQRDIRGPRDARHLVAYAQKLWPSLEGIPWTHVWNGKVAITADKHIHLHEPVPDVHIALGYNGRGVAMATAMGALIAERIAGARREDLPMPVTGMKPVPFRAFARLGVEFRLVYGRIRDRLGI